MDDLGGSHAFTDEARTRKQYPHVCWEHPLLYPGVMCPVWAVRLKDACDRVGLRGFGAELLRVVKRMFPNPKTEAEEDLEEPPPEGTKARERWEAREKALVEQERAGFQAVKAAIAVLDMEGPRIDQAANSIGSARNAREALAMKVLDVLEAGGLRYSPRASQEVYVRDVERSKLLVSVRLPGRS